MGLQINTNVQAINAQRNLSATGLKLGRALEKLSSGLRINRSADDAAGLAISEKLRSQIRGMQQAGRNAQDGISMLQTAEGSLAEVHALLQRQRELAVQAGNTTLSGADRTAIGEELVALKDEIQRIATSTTFNGQNLLTGSLVTSQDAASTLDVSAAVDNKVVTEIDVSNAKAGTTYTLTFTAGTDALVLDDGSGNSQLLTLDAAAAAAGQTVLDYSTLGVKITLDGPAESAADALGGVLNGLTVITNAGDAAATFQVGADAGQTISVSFGDMQTTAIGTGAGNQIADKITDNTAVSDTGKASTLLGIIDDAIVDVSTQRAKFGAAQNRMESTINSLGVVAENLSASESRIRDADIALVSSQLVTQQILQQAGISVLSQANQNPQAALQLLQ